MNDLDDFYTYGGCFPRIAAMVLFVIIMSIMLCSCKSTKQVSEERYTSEQLVTRLDSMLQVRLVTQQDSSFREYVVSQLKTLREKNDTSHTIVVDTAGRVIKETLIIRTEKESNSETDRKEREVIMHKLEVMDSTLVSLRSQIERTDTLLQKKQETIEVNRLHGWQKWLMWTGVAAILGLLIFIGYKIWRLWPH